jgi:hypothetical protein
MSSDEDHELIQALYALNKRAPKLCKPSIQSPPAHPEEMITTWKMNEFKYYDIPSPFPTLARGLFTRRREKDDKFEIVARGYDKFFNIGEVPWNTVGLNAACPSSFFRACSSAFDATLHKLSMHSLDLVTLHILNRRDHLPTAFYIFHCYQPSLCRSPSVSHHIYQFWAAHVVDRTKIELTDYTVARPPKIYLHSIHSHPQIERLHHLHRRALRRAYLRHLQALAYLRARPSWYGVAPAVH